MMPSPKKISDTEVFSDENKMRDRSELAYSGDPSRCTHEHELLLTAMGYSTTSCNYIPEIKNFGDIMVLVWTPPPPPPPHPPPHAKACVSRNCDTIARIKFIFDTAIDDLEWKNPIDFGENRKTKMATNGHFVKI